MANHVCTVSSTTLENVPLNLCAQRRFRSESSLGRGWLGLAKVSCILRDQGVQLILAYSWAKPAILVAILVAGKDRGWGGVGGGEGEMFLFLPFLPFHSCSSFFPCPSLLSAPLSAF